MLSLLKWELIIFLFLISKGYKLTKQGKSRSRLGWKKISSDMQIGNLLSELSLENHTQTISLEHEHLLFQRNVSLYFDFFFCLKNYNELI